MARAPSGSSRSAGAVRSPRAPPTRFSGQVDAAFDRDGAAGDDGPVGLLDVAASEQGGELAGGAGGAGEQQDAGGVAVEAVDQAGAVFGAEAQRVQHGVEVAGDAGAALDRQAIGLVEDQDVVVLVDYRVLQVLGIVRVDRGGWFGCGRGVHRGNFHRLAGGQAGAGVGFAPRPRGSGRCGTVSG